MAEDVIDYADFHGIEKFSVLGHSMGSRVAMSVCGLYPERVERAIIIDSAPTDLTQYPEYIEAPQKVLNSLHSEFKGITDNSLSEPEVETILDELYSKKRDRLFIKNMISYKEGKAQWKFNFTVLLREFENILSTFEVQNEFYGPVLVIQGEKSVHFKADVFKE